MAPTGWPARDRSYSRATVRDGMTAIRPELDWAFDRGLGEPSGGCLASDLELPVRGPRT